jgi:RNA polymerase sigma-70 factor (ECF subfamily)
VRTGRDQRDKMSGASTGWITLAGRRGTTVASADEGLIERCKAGDPEAWRELIEKHQRRVYNIAYHFVAHEQDADDLAQEVFVAVFRSLHSFRGESAFTTWLHRVAMNVCMNAQRGKARTPPLSWEELTQAEGGERWVLVDPESPPERAVLDQEAAALVRAKVAELPDHYRQAIILCDLQDVPYEEAARILKVSVGTIKSRVHRGRMLLKSKLRDYFG